MPTFDEILADRKAYPDDMKITPMDGVETTVGNLRAYGMRQSDYTQKTQTHARERDAFAAEKAQWEQAKGEAERLLSEMATRVVAGPAAPASQDEVEALLQRDPVAQRLVKRIEAAEAKIAERDKAVDDAQARLRQHEQTYMADQHRRVLASIKAQDPDVNEQDVVSFAQQNYIPRLDLAYRLMSEERRTTDAMKKVKEEATREAYERGKREASQPILPQRRLVEPLAPDAPKTFEEAANAALGDPEILAIMEGRG